MTGHNGSAEAGRTVAPADCSPEASQTVGRNWAALCGLCEAPLTDAPPRCMVCGHLEHRPSVVTELPPHRWLYCLACQRPWPCPSAPTDSAITQPEGN